MPKLSEAALGERRDHILRAAEICFARDGFHHTTIADVRREAGVSTGSIYTYFPNKEAMMGAILERARDERKRQLDMASSQATAGDADAPTDPSAVLLAWAAAIDSPRGRHAARVDVNLWAEALRNPQVRMLAQAALGEARSTIRSVVSSRLPASDRDEALDAETVASVLIALFLGLEVQTAVGMPLDEAKVRRVLATLFAEYLPTAPPTGPVAKPTSQRNSKRSTPNSERTPRRRKA